MKLGSKKTKQAELLDALGGELAVEEQSAPASPVHTPEPVVSTKDYTDSLPTVSQESVHVSIKETVSVDLMREGGINSLEIKGDMNLHVSDDSLARIRLLVAPLPSGAGTEVQFKQHPNVVKFQAQQERVVALKDPARGFPVNQPLGVLKWRYSGKDEIYVPLSSMFLLYQYAPVSFSSDTIYAVNCWPSPSNDGTCEVNIEYELENEALSLYDVIISIPLPAGSYPTVSSHTGEWSLDPSSHSLDWSIAKVSADDRSGSLEFSVGGDDAGAFFPVKVSFVAQGSLAGVSIASVDLVDGDAVTFSQEATVSIENYVVSG